MVCLNLTVCTPRVVQLTAKGSMACISLPKRLDRYLYMFWITTLLEDKHR